MAELKKNRTEKFFQTYRCANTITDKSQFKKLRIKKESRSKKGGVIHKRHGNVLGWRGRKFRFCKIDGWIRVKLPTWGAKKFRRLLWMVPKVVADHDDLLAQSR